MSLSLAVTGIGCISAAGAGVAAYTTALEHGSSLLACYNDERWPLANNCVVGKVDDSLLPHHQSRTVALALAAAQEAQQDADCQSADLLCATCTMGMAESETAFLAGQMDGPAYACHTPAATATAIAQDLGVTVVGVHSLACASFAAAIIDAMERIRSGQVQRLLVVGADALCRTTLAGFSSLQVVDQHGCKPFSQDRQGMSIGEGAVALLLEHPESAAQRQAVIHGYLSGWGNAADAYHDTAPDPSGKGLRTAITAAIADAGGQLPSFICAHGTGTQDNDAVEATVFADLLPQVPLASQKYIIGHTMGCAAGFALIAALTALAQQRTWPHKVAQPIESVRCADGQPLHFSSALCTTLAFGGANMALLCQRGTLS